MVRDLKDAAKQPSRVWWSVGHMACLEWTDTVLKGYGCASIHYRWPIIIYIDDCLWNHAQRLLVVLCVLVSAAYFWDHHHHHVPARVVLLVLLQSEILIKTERLTRFSESVLPGHSLDRRLKLFLHLLLQLILRKGSLFAPSVIRCVESVLRLLGVVSGRWTVILISYFILHFLMVSKRCHIFGLFHGLIARGGSLRWCHLLCGLYRLDTLRKILIMVSVLVHPTTSLIIWTPSTIIPRHSVKILLLVMVLMILLMRVFVASSYRSGLSHLSPSLELLRIAWLLG